MNQDGLQPGIYFNLPENIYHSDRAISRGDIINMLDTPATYWANSWMNPERKEIKKSIAMDYGSAFHKKLFEPEKFTTEYQILGIDPWDDNKKIISHEDYFAIDAAIKVLRRGKDSSLFLTGGMPEVTIVFDYNGLRYRTRHDYVTPVFHVDFKTSRSLHIQVIKREFEERGLDVQMYLYKLSRTMFKEQFAAGEAHVYGTVDKKFFQNFMNEVLYEFIFIFQRKTAPYPFLPLWTEEDTEINGKKRADKAADIYKLYMKQYGMNPWPVSEGKLQRFSMFYGSVEEN